MFPERPRFELNVAGLWARSQHSALSGNGPRQDTGIWPCSKAEATEDDSVCTAVGLPTHWNNNNCDTDNREPMFTAKYVPGAILSALRTLTCSSAKH